MELTKERFGLNPRFVERVLNNVRPFIESALESNLILSSGSRMVVLVTTTTLLEKNGLEIPFKEENSLLISRFGKNDGWWDEYKKSRMVVRNYAHETNWEYYKQEAMFAIDDLTGFHTDRSRWFLTDRRAVETHGAVVACAGVGHQFSEMFASWLCAAIRCETLSGP